MEVRSWRRRRSSNVWWAWWLSDIFTTERSLSRTGRALGKTGVVTRSSNSWSNPHIKMALSLTNGKKVRGRVGRSSVLRLRWCQLSSRVTLVPFASLDQTERNYSNRDVAPAVEWTPVATRMNAHEWMNETHLGFVHNGVRKRLFAYFPGSETKKDHHHHHQPKIREGKHAFFPPAPRIFHCNSYIVKRDSLAHFPPWLGLKLRSGDVCAKKGRGSHCKWVSFAEWERTCFCAVLSCVFAIGNSGTVV